MPPADNCQIFVVHALEKEGWTIAPTSLTIRIDAIHLLHIDVWAYRGENGQQRVIIVVEIKCFADPRAETTDLYTAIGQYLVYRNLLRDRGMEYPLYLAVPTEAYHGVIQRMGMSTIAENRIKMIVVDMENEMVERWLEW